MNIIFAIYIILKRPNHLFLISIKVRLFLKASFKFLVENVPILLRLDLSDDIYGNFDQSEFPGCEAPCTRLNIYSRIVRSSSG